MRYLTVLVLLVSSYAWAMRTANIPIIINGDMGQSTVTSSPILLDQIAMLSIQASYGDSSVTGNFTVNASDDMGKDTLGNGVTNWSLISGSSLSAAGASTVLWNFPNIGHKWAELVYTRSGGSTVLNARAMLKGD